MMTQKVIITLMIIFLAVIVASILKFAEKNQVHTSTIAASFFMPILLPMFMIYFFMYVYKKDFLAFAFTRKIIQIFRFIFLEIQITPLIHTTLIDIICCLQKEPDSKFVIFQFKRSSPAKVAVENLHGRVSFASKLA